MTGIPRFLFLSQTIWTTLPETLKPWRDGNSSFRLLKKQILLAEVMSLSRTLASHHVITPWHDYEGSIDELEITRAPCTPPPPLCMYIFLFLSFLLLISWLHRGNMPACTQFLLSPCHETGTLFLHSSKIHIQLSAFQKLVATVLQAFQHHHHLLCSHLPQITGGQCRTQREREGRNVEKECYCPGLPVRNTVGMQMLYGTGLGLLGKELALLFPTFCYVPSQYKGSLAFSFYHPYSIWFKLPQTITITWKAAAWKRMEHLSQSLKLANREEFPCLHSTILNLLQ